MADILARHQVLKRQADEDLLAGKPSTSVGIFEVTPQSANVYAAVEQNEQLEDQKQCFVEIKIFDVLFNRRVCSLVYLCDVTSMYDTYGQPRRNSRSASESY